MLKNSPVLYECSSHCVQHLALYGNPQEYTVNDCACISEEISKSLPLRFLYAPCHVFKQVRHKMDCEFIVIYFLLFEYNFLLTYFIALIKHQSK